MNAPNLKLSCVFGALAFVAGVGHVPEADAQSSAGGIDVAQQPLFTQSGQPPLNMLVMGKDHKIYYEAYNDASDLDGDGALDIGYKPESIDYYGYFDSHLCYTWSSGNNRFEPTSATANKQCSGTWSGDFLNYATTSRMDALRRVLYGGWRQVDSATDTVLQGAFFPQDAHSWGKEYQSVARDGYDISQYTPLALPPPGRYHLFAVTTVTGNANAFPNYQAPLFRVLKNTDKRVWNWLSIEGPVAGNKCFTSTNSRVDCVPATPTAGTWDIVPASMLSGVTITTWKRTVGSGSPTTLAAMNTLFSGTNISTGNRCGTGSLSTINVTGANNNPFTGPANNGCTHDNYLTLIEGSVTVPADGTYRFGVDGDDAVDLRIGSTDVVGWYGGHGNDRSDGGLTSHSNTIYLTAGTHAFRFRHQEGTGDDNWGLFVYTAGATVARDDYYVRVQSCPASNAALRESTCKEYPNGQFKPTGILHDYGESDRMYFGLITGSQFNNLQGGVLRKNVTSFAGEINENTGQFRTNVNGIANTISKLRMIGGGYANGTTNNLNSDSNWGWGNGTGNCPSVGNRAINNGECRMWGNPLAEMVYESMRYFAGSTGANSTFSTGGASQGGTEETTMGLDPTNPVVWKNPYAAAPEGGGYLACSKPYQTLISDINPSYDGDVPGSAFASVTAPSGTPATISSFNAANEGGAIWNAEFGASTRNVFIGQSGSVSDGAPTAKSASSFGNIRGLSPEEPTKGGTFYTASVARYARNTDISAATGVQNLSTYSIALASPLPRIDFPVGGGNIALLPFAKTASGTFGDGDQDHKPTNTIVDFYVETIANLPGQPFNASINGGRAYAVFRINYEDVEQGNDHDMDAIVRYLISENDDGTATVTLNSEYAAGSANQVVGYVLSGTTQDGVYLEVRDTDAPTCRYAPTTCDNGFKPYNLNTPPGRAPGFCVGNNTDECGLLPLTATRVFTPNATGARGTLQLENPLWYAAKYGAPVPTANDANGDGVPDNYFLVTNPATLRAQLDRAFANIIDTSQPTASVATSTPRFVPGATLAYSASYASSDWSGDVQAFKLRDDGSYYDQPVTWSASQRMPAPASRSIFTAEVDSASGTTTGVPFTSAGLTTTMKTQVQGTLDPLVYDNSELLAYLRGDKSNEQGATGCSATDLTDCPYRVRSSRLGDILNSTPAVIGVSSFGYGSLLRDLDPTAAGSYAAFVEGKKARFGASSQNPVIFVGSNDGMMHALDGSDSSSGGRELFAYIPNAVLGNLQYLAQPGYVHRFYVDGSPTISDAYIGDWKTVLLASTGAGARSVFALDVTDPASFGTGNVMWEFNSSIDPRMGQFVGRPYMGITEGGNWVAVFGNGLNGRTRTGQTADSEDNHAVLFIRDLETGADIATIDTGWGCSTTAVTASGNVCTGAEGARMGPNGLATAVLVDNDGNGAGDTIYAGDYQGNLWRFEQDATTHLWSLGNGGSPLFTARDSGGKRQSITSGAYTVANPLGGTMVVFGTGRYLNADDADETRIGDGTRAAADTLYGIWDPRLYLPGEGGDPGTWYQLNAVGTPVGTRADLQQQSITGYTPMVDGDDGYRMATRHPIDYRSNASPTGKMGWYMDLTFTSGGNDLLAGERVTATPQGILGDVVFNTFRPEGDSCDPGSQNATMVLNSLSGSAGYAPVEPDGGWAAGDEPPAGNLVGTDTRRGPPPGEPPIVVVRPPPGQLYAVPCLQGSEDCAPPCDPATEECSETVDKCIWVSPNAAERMAGKPIPCGRISWKQAR